MLKILHLVLYSKDIHYDKMYHITREFYKKFSENVETFYYCYSEKTDFHDPYIDKDILFLFGSETRIPGILKKTIDAMEYFRGRDYDYMIRSNISTIIRFDLLIQRLMASPLDYGAGIVWTIRWTEPQDGLVDDLYLGYRFCSGTSIVFSRQLVKKIIKNKEKLCFEVIDDVALGILIQTTFPEISPVQIGHLTGHFEEVDTETQNFIFYRFKHPNRETDIYKMETFISMNDRCIFR